MSAMSQQMKKFVEEIPASPYWHNELRDRLLANLCHWADMTAALEAALAAKDAENERLAKEVNRLEGEVKRLGLEKVERVPWSRCDGYRSLCDSHYAALHMEQGEHERALQASRALDEERVGLIRVKKEVQDE